MTGPVFHHCRADILVGETPGFGQILRAIGDIGCGFSQGRERAPETHHIRGRGQDLHEAHFADIAPGTTFAVEGRDTVTGATELARATLNLASTHTDPALGPQGERLVYGGHVIYTGWFKGYGNLIILDHDNEYYTLYAHVADILVKEGDEVRQGQRIGTVGDTGSLEGPRLYFEVRFQGKPQDPEQWLRQRS